MGRERQTVGDTTRDPHVTTSLTDPRVSENPTFRKFKVGVSEGPVDRTGARHGCRSYYTGRWDWSP